MSLFGTILRQGAKAADNLFDDALVQTKNKNYSQPESDYTFADSDWRSIFPADDPRFDDGIPGFDPSLYEIRPDIPRPEHLPLASKDFTPEQKVEYADWRRAQGAVKERNKSLIEWGPEDVARRKGKAMRIALSKVAETEEQWVALNPPPFPGVDPMTLKGNDKKRHNNWHALKSQNGFANAPEYPDEFPRAEWIAANPHPVQDYGTRPVKDFNAEETKDHNAWKKRMGRAAEHYRIDAEERRLAKNEAGRDYYHNTPGQKEKKSEYGRKMAPDPHYRARRNESTQRRRRGARDASIGTDRDAVKEIHYIANLISEITGRKHHVDHIVPLRGQRPNTKPGVGERTVSGLHNQNNMRIMDGSENISKGAYFEPGQKVRGGGAQNARRLLKRIREKHGITE